MMRFMRISPLSPVNNPVLPISEDVLNVQVAELNADDPVAAFLESSEFTSVAPEGAEVRPHPPISICGVL